MGETPASSALVAEFIGTYILVFTVGCVVITQPPVWGGVSIAAVLTVMIYALAKVSGAHLNPAVTIAIAISKNEWGQVGAYIGVQMLAGVLAGLTYALTFWTAFNLEPTPGHTLWQAALAEVLYTFMLCFVVLNVCHVSDEKKEDNLEFGPLAIGFVIVAGAYGGGSISMGCFNPAVALGIDISSAFFGFKYSIIYMIFEFIGAFMAGSLYKAVRSERMIDETGKEVYPVAQRLVSEFLGTFMLVLTVGLNVLSGSPAGAFSIAASLMCMIFALGDVSGAHFNPAVTTACLVSNAPGRAIISASNAFAYMGVQLFAGIMAALTYSFMMGGKTFGLGGTGYNWMQIIMAEFVFTFVLCFVVFSVATMRRPTKQFFGFAIGMCVTAGGFAIGKVSGGSLNPAVSFGIAVSHMLNGGGLMAACIYSITEIVAGAVAALAFKVIYPGEYQFKDKSGDPMTTPSLPGSMATMPPPVTQERMSAPMGYAQGR